MTLTLRPSVTEYQRLADTTGWVRAPTQDTPGVEAWALPDGRVWLGLAGTLPDPADPQRPPYGVGSVAPNTGQNQVSAPITDQRILRGKLVVGNDSPGQQPERRGPVTRA